MMKRLQVKQFSGPLRCEFIWTRIRILNTAQVSLPCCHTLMLKPVFRIRIRIHRIKKVLGAPGSGSTTQSYESGSGSFYHQAKIVRKTLIPSVLWLLLDFLSLKNYVNVLSKSNKQKNFFKNLFYVGVLKVNDENSQRHRSADPDPHQNVMDPQHWHKQLKCAYGRWTMTVCPRCWTWLSSWGCAASSLTGGQTHLRQKTTRPPSLICFPNYFLSYHIKAWKNYRFGAVGEI